MHWPWWVWPAAAGPALVGALISFAYQVRQRRHDQPAKDLIAEAVGAMVPLLGDAKAPGLAAHRSMVDLLAAQQAWAEHMEERVRPRVLALTSKAATPGSADEAADGGHDVAQAIRSLINTLPSTGIAAAADTGSAGSAGSGGSAVRSGVRRRTERPLGRVPKLDGREEVGEVYAALARTVATRVRQAELLLALAAESKAVEPGVRRDLAAAVAAGGEACRESREPARKGRYLTALGVLVRVDIPVPEGGIPGEATRRDLESHVSRLRDLAEDYHSVLLAWCGDALSRCTPPKAKGATR